MKIEKLLLGKNMITQLFVYWIILISNKIINCNSLSKQQALDVDPKAKDQANFTGNLGSCRKNKSFSLLEKEKK